jgi:hypothetical protein
LVVAIPLAAKQGALMALHRFRGLGLNLVLEGSARFLCGAVAGRAFGVTGLAAGITVGTAVALLALRLPLAHASRQDRPRTSLVDTSLTLALLGLYVQVDVLIAPSVLARAGATTYDLAAVPSKGVYLVLLAAGPLLFPFVRRRQGGRRLIVGSALVTLAVGVVVTALLVAALPLIAAVLGRPRAGLTEFSLLGLAMTLAPFRYWDREPSLVLGLPTRCHGVLRCRSDEPGLHDRPQRGELPVGPRGPDGSW